MADIRPFKAVRPAEGFGDIIAALPYDVYDRKEAKELVMKEPHSFLAIDRAETQFDDTVDIYADCVYEKASEMLRSWIHEGSFIKEEKACYYIYELTMNGRKQTGIGAVSSIDDYKNNIIKKHENTRAEKEVDRIRHVDTCNAQTGPIFLAYRGNEKIRTVVEKNKNSIPVYDFTKEDGITHRIWVIDKDEDILMIHNAFSEMDSIYIADGHHRCASAVRVGMNRREANPEYDKNAEFNYFLSVLFPDEELMIMDYNRVVKDLAGLSLEVFCEKLSSSFIISNPLEQEFHPENKGQIGMYLDGKWYKLTMKDEVKSTDPVDGLDVSILQKYVLDEILGIKDPKTDKRIDFVGGIRGLEELKSRVDQGAAVAFAMFPTDIHELFAVSDAGRLMPPKSTWFEPKLRSGLLIHDLLEESLETLPRSNS